MATATLTRHKVIGGSFLIEDTPIEQVFTPEDFNEQHHLIAQTTEDFAIQEIIPNIDKIEHKDFGVTRELLKKASDLGLTSADVPEEYGGTDLDKVSSAIIADRITKSGSFVVSFGGHVGIGMLPIVYFGTKKQKEKYLPRMSAGELIGAYALSESSSASDALNCRTKAVLSSDGTHYVLNGEKTWITNAGFADIFIVFAKIDGEKFTAFIIERNFPGFSVGAEEHKMGIRGSSTCPLILNDCQVPAENLLGEIGKGHVIAFNILNVGRFKLGAGCVGGARNSLQHAIDYAKQRKAFNKVISDFGLIREKLANMAVGVYAGESAVYRTVGMMDVALAEVDKTASDAAIQTRKAIEEYAIECSMIKVWASEMIDYAVDETVQIFGGYGFVEEYPAERAYRDARVNRIFEGTNEINRMITTGWMLRKAMSGQLPLMPAIKKLMDEVMSAPAFEDPPQGVLSAETSIVSNAKKIGLFLAGAASQKYNEKLPDQQEIMGALADILMEVYVMESALLRTQKLVSLQGEASSTLPIAMLRVYLTQGMDRIEASGRKVSGAIAEGDMLRMQSAIVRRLSKYEPFNTVSLRQQIAQKVIDAGKYVTA